MLIILERRKICFVFCEKKPLEEETVIGLRTPEVAPTLLCGCARGWDSVCFCRRNKGKRKYVGEVILWPGLKDLI